MEAEIYRDRLVDLRRCHDRLRETYNEAVRKTAVSELLVDKGRVCVQIRTTEGVIETIRTPFAATSEIYVDFVVLDGRLWFRRVFDARTTPDQAVVIGPKLAQIDWDTVSSAIGKVVYRRLDDGRWVVTVTGDGSLGLARRNPDTATGLQSAPQSATNHRSRSRPTPMCSGSAPLMCCGGLAGHPGDRAVSPRM